MWNRPGKISGEAAVILMDPSGRSMVARLPPTTAQARSEDFTAEPLPGAVLVNSTRAADPFPTCARAVMSHVCAQSRGSRLARLSVQALRGQTHQSILSSTLGRLGKGGLRRLGENVNSTPPLHPSSGTRDPPSKGTIDCDLGRGLCERVSTSPYLKQEEGTCACCRPRRR